MKFSNHALEQLEKRDNFDEKVTQKEILKDIRSNKKSIKSSWPHRYHITWQLFSYIISIDTIITVMIKKCRLSKPERRKYNKKRRQAKYIICNMEKDYRKEIIKQIKW